MQTVVDREGGGDAARSMLESKLVGFLPVSRSGISLTVSLLCMTLCKVRTFDESLGDFTNPPIIDFHHLLCHTRQPQSGIKAGHFSAFLADQVGL